MGASLCLSYKMSGEGRHHSLDAQKLEVAELLHHAPPEIRDKCVGSFDRMTVRGMGHGTIRETLLPQHRMAHLMGPLLDAAYMLVVEGNAFWSRKRMHFNGSGMIFTDSLERAAQLIDGYVNTGLPITPDRQDVGVGRVELGDVCVSAKSARCYLARTVADVVAGTWIKEVRLGRSDFISAFNAMAWTLITRGDNQQAGRILLSSMRRRVPGIRAADAEGVLRCTLSVNGGPVMGKPTQVRTLRITGLGDGPVLLAREALPDWATRDYLSQCSMQIAFL
eukprot:GHVN01102706.1.p1 GENE.GHVN01102706.1~~GHVN01102706.1.p1  ORF type:complete len:279 (+),score=3.77 GHVN01102706.1:717-1553(+)